MKHQSAWQNCYRDRSVGLWLRLFSRCFYTVIQKIEGLINVREKNAYESITRGGIEYINILMEGQRRKELPELSKLEGLLSARMGKVEHDL